MGSTAGHRTRPNSHASAVGQHGADPVSDRPGSGYRGQLVCLVGAHLTAVPGLDRWVDGNETRTGAAPVPREPGRRREVRVGRPALPETDAEGLRGPLASASSCSGAVHGPGYHP